MPRPTTLQVACGCATVVLSTLAVLLLADVRSGGPVVAVAAACLVLGLAVAAAVGRGSRRVPALAAGAATPAGTTVAARPTTASRPAAARSARARARAERVREHSLRG